MIGALFVHAELGGKTSWTSFLAGTGAIILTLLAGAELDPQIFRTKWKEVTVLGLVGFFGPFWGARQLPLRLALGGPRQLAGGVALSTTPVAVVYAVMLELGLNVIDFGEAKLAACFVNDLGTVIASGWPPVRPEPILLFHNPNFWRVIGSWADFSGLGRSDMFVAKNAAGT